MESYEYVIVGGGLAGGSAVKELVKRGGASGKICLISADDTLPYDRTTLSKAFFDGRKSAEQILLSPPEFYGDSGVRVLLNTRVLRLAAERRCLALADGSEVGYEKLLLATGSKVRTFALPGSDLPRLLYLRSLADARRILAAAEAAQQAVVIGGSFIAMEIASALAKRGIATTMVFPEERVWQTLFTPEMSAFFAGYYRQHGVAIRPGVQIAAFRGQGRVAEVELASGEALPADLVVAGIGVRPAVHFLEGSGLQLDNGIVVNEFLETNLPNVWAAGDVANYPDMVCDCRRRVEHWDTAVEQGKRVARNMSGSRRPYDRPSYFFSDVFDLSWEFWGYTAGADQVVYRGDVSAGRFSAWWLKGERLVAAFVLNRPDDERTVAPEWIKSRRSVVADELRDESHPLG